MPFVLFNLQAPGPKGNRKPFTVCYAVHWLAEGGGRERAGSVANSRNETKRNVTLHSRNLWLMSRQLPLIDGWVTALSQSRSRLINLDYNWCPPRYLDIFFLQFPTQFLFLASSLINRRSYFMHSKLLRLFKLIRKSAASKPKAKQTLHLKKTKENRIKLKKKYQSS